MVDGQYEVRRIKLYFDYTEGVGRRLTYDGSGTSVYTLEPFGDWSP